MTTGEPAACACAATWPAGVRVESGCGRAARADARRSWHVGLALRLARRGELCRLSRASQVEKFPEGTIAKIEFEGTTIPADKIKPKLLSRVGQPLNHEKVEADLKTLMGTKWFSDVRLLRSTSRRPRAASTR